MSQHVWYRECYEKHRRDCRALVDLAQDRNHWCRVAQWAARSAAPAEFYNRPKQPTRGYQAA
eukprot:13230992-Alexandrium_andersonii.AAC.1